MGIYLMAESWWLEPDNLISMAKAAFGLGMVIFVHELGHFLVAKACGVKCEKFYVGFDVPLSIGPLKLPSSLWKKQWGETEYGIGIIPLGGYVKMLGQDDNPSNAAAEAERIRLAKENPDGSGEVELDPRSYPAKSVPQRMAIISAGVVMNLIFAVLFAAAAYMMGLKYNPAIVGATMPGDSAWRSGMQPRDHMIQLGRNGRRDEQLRFRDLRYNVMKSGEESTLEVLVKQPDDSEGWITVQPNSRDDEFGGLATIGVISPSSNKVYQFDYEDGSSASQSDLEKGDRIQALMIQGQFHDAQDAFTIRRLMYQFPSEPMTVVVNRQEDPDDESSESTRVEIPLSPQPIRELGLRMEMGPVVAVQHGSPAEQARFQIGDILLAVAGKSIDDPLRIDDLLRDHVGTPIRVTVERTTDGQAATRVELTVSPRPLEMLGEAGRKGGSVSAESLGVAFQVSDVVAQVLPDSPADRAGLRAGDRITQVEFVQSEASAVDDKTFRNLQLQEPIEFDDERPTWAFADAVLQSAPSGLEVRLTYQRDQQPHTAVLSPVDSTVAFQARRGLYLDGMTRTRTAASLGEAFRLGVRETKEGIQQVFVTLQRIGKLFKHLGGPGTIAVAATAEASEGLPRLLVFLTLLSANLAVLNFLPIPVLDGGHMMFLIYEGIFGRPMNERIAFVATMVGLCFILGLMVFVIGMDVYRFSG